MSKDKPFNGNANYDGLAQMRRGLTPVDLIKERLKQSYDPAYRSSLYNQMRYAFGESWQKGKTYGATDGSYPDFPDIYVRFQELGRSRKVLNNQFIALSRVMYSDPKPEFLDIDKVTAEIRQQFFVKRFKRGGWNEETELAFMEGDGLGLGFLQHTLKTNPETGRQYVDLRHSPTIYTLWDRMEPHPSRFRWIAFVRYMAVEDAEVMFGKEIAQQNATFIQDTTNNYPIKMVKYFEYYDRGVAGGTPTRALILRNMNNDPVQIEANPFGCLPMSYFCHFYAPGMRFPVGKIALQMATQETVNEIERALRQACRNAPATLIDPEQVEASDLKKWNAGAKDTFIRLKTKPGATQAAVQRTPGAEASETLLRMFEIWNDQLSVDSGVTDFDRGVQPEKTRTLGENMLVDQRGQTQASWTDLQTMRMYVRIVETSLKIAALFDRDPITITIDGRKYPMNDPLRPGSLIEAWMKDEAETVINAADLRYQDVEQARIQKIQELTEIANFVGPNGALNLKWFAEELAEAIGVDPNQAINPAINNMAAELAPQQQQPGQPPIAQMPPLIPQNALPPGTGAPPAVSNPAFRTPPMAPPPPGAR